MIADLALEGDHLVCCGLSGEGGILSREETSNMDMIPRTIAKWSMSANIIRSCVARQIEGQCKRLICRVAFQVGFAEKRTCRVGCWFEQGFGSRGSCAEPGDWTRRQWMAKNNMGCNYSRSRATLLLRSIAPPLDEQEPLWSFMFVCLQG